MKLFRKTALWILLLLLLILTVGCEEKPATPAPTTPAATTPTDPPEPTEDPRQKELTDKYLAAIEASLGDSYALNVQYKSSVTVAGKTYRESHETIQEYRGIGTENFVAKINDTVTYGDKKYTAEYQEIFSGGTVYQKIDEARFYSELTEEDFLDRYTPAQMLTPELYTLSANEGDTLISFESATAGESWVLPEEDAELISASGTAELDGEGKLLKTTYDVTFRYGAAEHTAHYEVAPGELGREPAVPKDTEDYILLDKIDGTLMLEHFYGYLSQLRHGSVNSYDLMVSAAAGVYTGISTSFDAYAQGMEYAAQNESRAQIYDSDGSSEEVEILERMVDGKYTYTMDGKKENASSQTTQEMFEGESSDKLMALAYGSEYVQSMDISVVGDAVLLEIIGNETMGEEFCYDTGVSLFQDGDLLDGYATDYRTETMEYYVALDRYSLLPTAMGMKFEGIHTIDGYELSLTRQVDRSIDMASMSAYSDIFEEPEPEDAPENPATPLFYHVTGADGQEMWLLGTIHLGDVRTGFLPEEIYDAFYSSDAFAVECDTDEFDEQVEEDEALQEQLSELYFYSDDTTIADHLDTPELYEEAKRLMKATGNYYYNSEYMKPYLWSSSIENYYLRSSYSLSSEKGVEQRLLKLADEADIPIREVESAMFQTEMLTTYSDEMQELMLFGSICSGVWEYCESVQELYEMWCTGDEAALAETINTDEDEQWQISEEDIDLTDLEGEDLERAQAVLENLETINAQLAQLQEEYSNSMYIERNAGMLEIAIEYLESDDVVFYAVGLAHLLAEDGLVNTLREAGYTVELVSYQ